MSDTPTPHTTPTTTNTTAKPTAAPWDVHEHAPYSVWADRQQVAACRVLLDDGTWDGYFPATAAECEANADLIVAACNAAQATNPEHPIAAAKALPALLAACQEARAALQRVRQVLDRAIAQAEGRED
jgi:hypothetical protein